MTIILITLVKLYKLLLSPLLPFNTCRYTPSCSEYAIEALNKHGWLSGTWLSVKSSCGVIRITLTPHTTQFRKRNNTWTVNKF